jgi:hypothetical protein
VKLAEDNRIKLVWVPEHMGIDGNKTADQLAGQDSSHPLIGPKCPWYICKGCQGTDQGPHAHPSIFYSTLHCTNVVIQSSATQRPFFVIQINVTVEE